MAAVNVDADPLPDPEVKEIVDTWIDTLKIPIIAGGSIREDEHFLNVLSTWIQDDGAKKDRVAFSRTYTILKSSLATGTPIISASESVTVDGRFSVPSKSGIKRAALSADATGTQFLQIWEHEVLLKTYNLRELNLHQSVYTGGFGVTMTWNQSETALAYLAEKKVTPVKAFYPGGAIPPKQETEAKSEEEKFTVGEEYAYRQTWGEQLPGIYDSVIVVLDVTTDEFKVLPFPEQNFPTDIQWIGDSHICGTTYPIPVWRLGLLFCSNRESIIFSIQADGENFELITQPKHAARSPRIRPDGNFLVWQERPLDGPHERARSIHGVELRDGKPLGEPRLIYDSEPINGMPVYADFLRDCWTVDGSALLVGTPNEGIIICLAIPIDAVDQVKRIDGLDSILAITSDYLLVTSSTTATAPVLKLLSIKEDYKPIPITSSGSAVEFPIVTQFIYGEFSPPSIFIGPESAPRNSVPLVVLPHGGPHSTSVDSFAHEIVLLLKLGYAVIRMNYVGSIGGIRDTADELMGNIGNRDVKDCYNMTQKALDSNITLNPEKIILLGASHGGFLSAHLIGQYPNFYKAAVMINPAIDIATMIGTSDIADWALAETRLPFPEDPMKTLIPAARDLIDAEKYIAVSPIHYAQNVEGACLFLLGSLDLRVPSQQGINFYRALKAYGKIAEIRMYPDSHGLSTPPVRFDYNIQTAIWFKRYLP